LANTTLYIYSRRIAKTRSDLQHGQLCRRLARPILKTATKFVLYDRFIR